MTGPESPRGATGSVTFATFGILAPVAADLSNTKCSVMVPAIGSGSLFLPPINDAGFGMAKENPGSTVAQTSQRGR
ncbi:GntT/GntP/DsdX family permease [Nocardia cyriacigeorgica]|uniref:GntT/GntP/DsdX family permease n=1 Tax=Nocardia cyriacigeorgica TaxID=135487 RepID=UPI002811AA94|nr:hypothetical protein [Nocardia cyriacigeorgica]